MARKESAAALLILTEQTLLPIMRQSGSHEAADDLLRATTVYVNDPENAEIVALAQSRGFRWMETGD